ncbi:DUF305 domain-containing protein [Pseudonocardia sp. C8]|uniref:DUF305 domain-containing protein n=1 Tax=Pseudonocardia sp. C8 TaxID=2762759 RepID=UPI0016429BD9|nr:DUF305 domain-containing protein [Pseudonocardia sp. C8]MBC3193169.1 DUF305 domain-containing protein [Pseudonocardia sp. C8]
MKIQNVAVAATTLTAALVLTACGGGEPAGSAGPAPVPTSAAAPAHNQADIAFAQGMIPHHQQAVEMAELAADRAGSDDVRRLATAIGRAQAPEIARMRGFLAAWGAPESGGMPGMDHGSTGHGTAHGAGHRGMAGMMTDEQLRGLEQARGAGFDRMFLEMMIRHHEGAVQMARAELADGTNAEAKALARQVVDAQQAEITEMRELLG